MIWPQRGKRAVTRRRHLVMRRRQFALGIGFTALAGVLMLSGALNHLEGPTFDWRARLFGHFSPAPSPDIVIVAIDEQSLDSVQGWPWDRVYLAEAVRELTRAGAKVIALDILLEEPQDERPAPGDKSSRIDGDKELAAAIAAHGAVVVPGRFRAEDQGADSDKQRTDAAEQERAFAALIDAMTDDLSRPPHPADPASPSHARGTRARAVQAATTILDTSGRSTIEAPDGAHWVRSLAPRPMLEVFAHHAAMMCNSSIIAPDAGGVVRRVPAWVEHRARLWPGLGVGAAAEFIAQRNGDSARSGAGPDWEVTPCNARVGSNPDRRTFDLPMISSRSGQGGRADGLMLITWPQASHAYLGQFTSPGLPDHEISIGFVLQPTLIRRAISENLAELDALFTAAAARNLYDPQGQIIRPANLRPARPDDPEWRALFETQKALAKRIAAEAADDLTLFGSTTEGAPLSPADAVNLAGLRAIAQGIPALVDECAAGTQRIVSARSDLRNIVHGKLCFVGWAATGALADFVNTSIHPRTPGVFIHAAVANSILTGFSRRSAGALADSLFVGLLGLMGTAIGSRVRPALAPLAIGALIVLWFLVCGIALWDGAWLVASVTGPSLAAGGAAGAVLLHRLLIEEAARRRTEQRFRSYVSPAVVDILVENPHLTSMAPQKRELTIMFSDLAGFTSVAERLGSEKTGEVLARYLGAMTRSLQQTGATLDKYLGDGIMAFWGAPLDDPHHAHNACTAALTMLETLSRLNDGAAFGDAGPLRMRIGMAAGEVMVGDFGNPPFNSTYTVLGDAANLASRLEHLNKRLGTFVLASDRVRALAGDGFLWRLVGTVLIRGRTAATPVHELVGSNRPGGWVRNPAGSSGTPVVPSDWIALTDEAVGEYQRAHFDRAKTLFQRLDTEFGDHDLARVYLESIQFWSQRPDNPDFDGTIVLSDL